MVKKGGFREDLFYRIKVISVKLPALIERRCDIPLLCDHFIGLFNTRYRKEVKGISDDALNVLLSHPFPGNIRELENIIEHAFIFCGGDTIEINHLPAELKAENENREMAKSVSGVHDFKDLEKVYIESILEETGGNKLEAAKKLGVHKATLFRKIRQLGIRYDTEVGGRKSEKTGDRQSVKTEDQGQPT
jgi:transcriptional regulator with PAS, ATPase and Fis domain